MMLLTSLQWKHTLHPTRGLDKMLCDTLLTDSIRTNMTMFLTFFLETSTSDSILEKWSRRSREIYRLIISNKRTTIDSKEYCIRMIPKKTPSWLSRRKSLTSTTKKMSFISQRTIDGWVVLSTRKQSNWPFLKQQLLEHDNELEMFKDRLFENAIDFPPSYPFTEDNCGTTYMKTRCPAWCDRIVLSHSAKGIIANNSSVSHLCLLVCLMSCSINLL